MAKVEVDSVPCTIVNMDFFNKLFRQGLSFNTLYNGSILVVQNIQKYILII